MPRPTAHGARPARPSSHAVRRSAPRTAAALDDGVLDTDSEEDEFAAGHAAGPSRLAGSDEDDEEDEDEDEEDEDGEGSGAEAEYLDADEDEEGDGVGQWAPDDWDEAESDAGESGSEPDEDDEQLLQKDLGDLPLSTLARAQRSLTRDRHDAGSSKAGKVEAARARLADMQRAKGKALGAAPDDGERTKPARAKAGEEGHERARELAKRDHKHAPAAMSTKRQVSRLRQVVDVQKVDRRDPRFSSLSGTADAAVQARQYSFLPSLMRDELNSLRDALTAATKAERVCPLREKETFTRERERLEREVARARTRVERDERERRERDVLAQAGKEERERRAAGKGAWYMKKAEKKDLLLQARFQALEAKGKHAVKKAIDKKRRKEAGKEKKSRPFARGQGAGGSGGGGDGERGPKRRRV